MANVFFKTSTNKTIDDLFIWTKSSGTLEPNYDEYTGVPFSLGTVYFTSDGYIVFDTKDGLGNNKRIWMSKNAYSAIYAEDISNDIDNEIDSTTVYYGTCNTSASTRAKTVTCQGFVLTTGATVIIKMTNAQTYSSSSSANVTLNINNTGAINLKSYGTTQAPRYCWVAGEIITVVYDGTNYILLENGLATTTYYGMTKLNNTITSTSSSLAVTPAALCNFIANNINDAPIYANNTPYNVGAIVRYNQGIYKCIVDIPTGDTAWTAAHWELLPTLQAQINEKANIAQTLEGYGITNAYTITESNETFLPFTGGTLTGNLTLDNSDFIIKGTGGPPGGRKWTIKRDSTGNLTFSKAAYDTETPTTTIFLGYQGGLFPGSNNQYDLGSSDLKWKNIYGTLKGNADTATNVIWSGITNKPTTLAGYGITDAKTKQTVITDSTGTSLEESDTRFIYSISQNENGEISVKTKSIPEYNYYIHPTTSGNKHIPSGGSSGQILRWSADGTAVWGNDNNTTYSAGTGLSLNGTTFNHSNSITAKNSAQSYTRTLTWGESFTICEENYDSQGHIVGVVNHNISLPSNPNTDFNVRQIKDESTNANYRILLSNSANDTLEDSISKKNANLIYNPAENKLSTGNIKLTGELDVTGNVYLRNQTFIESLSVGDVIINGNTAFSQIPTAPTAIAGDSSNQLATTEFVTGAVTGLAGPMRFIGSLGEGGTISEAPTPSEGNKGHTYKVITTGTYSGMSLKEGDIIISNGTSWVIIPSGDEPSGTVTSITLKAGNGISLDVDNTAITTSGIRTINHKDTSSVSNLVANGRTYITGLTFDTFGHVTGYTTGTETVVNTNTATAADNILDGSNSGTQITYAPYTSQQSKLSFDTSTTAPTRTDRLNLNGYLYATKLYSGGTEVKTKQTAVNDVSTTNATTTEFISSITQDTNGVISVVKKKLPTYNNYSHPTTTAAIAAAVKVGKDSLGHVVIGDALTPSDLGITITSTSVSNGTNTFNKYTHPTTNGNKHIPADGSAGQYLKWSAAGTAEWVNLPVAAGTISNTSITPEGTNAKSKVIIKATTTDVYSMTSAGSVTDGSPAVLTMSVDENETLTYSWTTNTPTTVILPGRSAAIKTWTGYTSGVDNTYAEAQTFTGTATNHTHTFTGTAVN